MKSKLKNLYNDLIENRKHEFQGWYESYQQFYNEVENIREEISTAEDLRQKEGFLRKLIYVKKNGVTTIGQSSLSEDKFEEVIKDGEFIESLFKLITESNLESYEDFSDIWYEKFRKNNPTRINRVAASCTLDVSTTVVPGKFDQVFAWLKAEKIIKEYPAEEQQDWFSKNIFLMNILKEEFRDELEEEKTDEFYLSQFVWELYEHLLSPFSLKKQVVKYGAPGTGKTYQARQQTALLFDIWKEEHAPDSRYTHESQIELVQFHSSYSYEDFMEGLRPKLVAGNVQLTLQNGVFKEFCRNAGQWERDVYDLGLNKDWEAMTIEALRPHREKLSGSHWSYIFEISDSSVLVSDAVPPFFFIIDEVNRAELSRVFGELMYCLEYRGVKGAIKTQYANLNSPETEMLNINGTSQFFIPTNVYLIGTMNTIDRSIESFDFALRRRFKWEEVEPDMALLKYHLKSADEGKYKHWADLADNLEELNAKIVEQSLLGPDYQIGHAYLMSLKYASRLELATVRACVWEDSIRPLLQEYLRGTGKEDELVEGTFKQAFGVS